MKYDLKKVSNLDSKVVYNKIDKKIFNKKVKGDKIIKKYNLKNKKVLLLLQKALSCFSRQGIRSKQPGRLLYRLCNLIHYNQYATVWMSRKAMRRMLSSC